jgi:hypothetical protein
VILPYLKGLLAKATKRPWKLDKCDVSVYHEDLRVADIRGWGKLQYRQNGAEEMDANGAIITTAINLLPFLINVAEKAQDVVDAGGPSLSGPTYNLMKSLEFLHKAEDDCKKENS